MDPSSRCLMLAGLFLMSVCGRPNLNKLDFGRIYHSTPPGDIVDGSITPVIKDGSLPYQGRFIAGKMNCKWWIFFFEPCLMTLGIAPNLFRESGDVEHQVWLNDDSIIEAPQSRGINAFLDWASPKKNGKSIEKKE